MVDATNNGSAPQSEAHQAGTEESGYVPRRLSINFGVGALGMAIVLNTPAGILAPFMTNFLGIGAGTVATLFLVSKLYDMVTDPLMGMVSDRTQSRWGRRRPYLLVGGIIGAIGISVLIGRVVTGFLLDHVRASVLSTVVMALPAIGCFLWGAGYTGPNGALIAAIFVGLAGGAEFDLVAYMTSRYFGLRHYGKLYGILFSSVIAGAAIGPLMFGFGFDILGSYGPVLITAAFLFVIGGISQLFLGHYPKNIQ